MEQADKRHAEPENAFGFRENGLPGVLDFLKDVAAHFEGVEGDPGAVGRQEECVVLGSGDDIVLERAVGCNPLELVLEGDCVAPEVVYVAEGGGGLVAGRRGNPTVGAHIGLLASIGGRLIGAHGRVLQSEISVCVSPRE